MSESDLSPFLPDSIAADSATAIVHGVITLVTGDEAEIAVDTIRRGQDEIRGTTLSVRTGAWQPDVGTAGWFFLDHTWDNAVLLMVRTRREMERVIAGLPRSDPRLLPDEIRRLFSTSDAVVIGLAVPTSGSEAVIDVVGVRKGHLIGAVSVSRGFDSDQPGGPWQFDTMLTSDSPGPNGIFFLNESNGRWLVMNPSDPRMLSPYQLDEATTDE